MGQRGKATADRIKSLDGPTGTEIEVEFLDALLAGFGGGGEGAFGGRDQAPFNEVGEFLALGPGEGGSGEMNRSQKKKDERTGEVVFLYLRIIIMELMLLFHLLGGGFLIRLMFLI